MFISPGLASNQNRARGLRDGFDHPEHVEHWVAATDDVRELITGVQRLLEEDVLLLETMRLEVLPNLQPEFVHAEWLGEVINSAQAHRLDRSAGRRVCRHHECHDVAIDLLGGAQHFDASDIGHLDVGEEQVDGRPAKLFDGIATVFGDEHLIAVAPQDNAQHLAH